MNDLLDRPIAFHPALARATGSIEAGILLSQFLYWHKRSQHEGNWFWCTQAEIEDQTCLSRFKQEGARKVLVKMGLLKEERRGTPAKLWFQVQEDVIQSITTQSRVLETSNQESESPAISLKVTETTSEINALSLSAREQKSEEYPDGRTPRWKHWEELPDKLRVACISAHPDHSADATKETAEFLLSNRHAQKEYGRLDLYLTRNLRNERSRNSTTAWTGSGNRSSPTDDEIRAKVTKAWGYDALEGLPG